MDSDNDDDSYESKAQRFITDLPRVRSNDPRVTELSGIGYGDFIHNVTNEEWEEIGRDISNNTHLKQLELYDGALDNEKASYLFSGLVRSSSIEKLYLDGNELSIVGVRTMLPLAQNANNLRELDLNFNNIQSEGFNTLLRALHDSPIEELTCTNCGIESIEIDADYFPRQLKRLDLSDNNINADGCRGIAKLLQGEDSTLSMLTLYDNKIDDEGVAALVDALQNNTSLKCLDLVRNNMISERGHSMLLKLVNDISSVKATLQSNHTLSNIGLMFYSDESSVKDEEFQQEINTATAINKSHDGNPEAAGREKVIQTQLHSARRAELTELQGVQPRSVFSEINPLHLPEVLSLVGRRYCQDELYAALKSSVAGVISTVNRKECLKQQLAYHEAKSAELRTEIAKIEATERSAMDIESIAATKDVGLS